MDTYVDYLPDNKVRHCYMIRDTGKGISEVFQQRMYHPFEQELQNEDERSGTGLGLYICKNLVSLLNGEIKCESNLGEGTVFTVTLTYDLASPEQIHLLKNSINTYEDRLLYGRNILVAEDNDIVAEVILRLLESKGIHGELARDGQEVVDFYKKRGPFHYQAIIMDVRMPVKNGLEASREIRLSGLEDCDKIPIIALTADLLQETESACLEAGMDACLRKPISREKLFSLLIEKFDNE